MKTSAVFYCLLMATTYVATWSIVGAAQEAETNEAAETQPAPIPRKRFVSDKLVLNVYAEPDQSSARIETIQTGDAVEEIERSGNLVRVRLDDGREGWVGASYLTSDEPAIIRLRELQRQQPSAAPRVDKASLDEIAQLKKENTGLRGQVNELQARLAVPVAPPPPQGETINAETPEPPLQAAVLPPPATSGVAGWLLAMLGIGALSYGAGYQTLARKLRKKFGGLKVY